MKILALRGRRAAGLALTVGVLGAIVTLVAGQTAAWSLDTGGTPSAVTGNSTWFSGFGGPYGGCGMTQDALETQDFGALNVYNTPGDYSFYNRPLTGADLAKMGMWNNGHNCGRWVQVSISDYCTGTNDGAAGLPFCRNGAWVADQYNGATLNMIVADSCGDANAWCRDDPYHLDLAQPSLNRFVLNGAPVALYPDHFNNRHITWKFIDAPNYSGDIQIGFLQGAQTWWGALAISHLPHGIHGVEYYSGGVWHAATMDGDMGQAYIAAPLVAQGMDFRIRVTDANDALVDGGREYSFSLPASCSGQCNVAYTKVAYVTSDPGSPTPSTSPSVSPSPSPSTSPSVSPTSTGTAATCTASYRTVNSWPGGFQGEVTVTAGSMPLTSWVASWTMGSGQSITSVWNGTSTLSGSTITVKSVAWNGALAASAATTFGFIGTGTPSTPAAACAA